MLNRMGKTPPRPATERPLQDFPYSKPEPWSWIPGTWIQPGTVFVTAEGRFYRLVSATRPKAEVRRQSEEVRVSRSSAFCTLISAF
jgi:hypothetical protein